MSRREAAQLLGSRYRGTPEQRAEAAATLGKIGGRRRAEVLSPRRRRAIGKLGFAVGRQRIMARAARGELPDSPVLRLYGLDNDM